MKKFLIYTFAILASALLVNFAAVLMHRSTVSSLIEEASNTIGKMGGSFTYKELSLTGFLMWDVRLEVLEPELKYGDAHSKKRMNSSKLFIALHPFQKEMSIDLKDDLHFWQDDSFDQHKHYIYQSPEPIVLKSAFNISFESFASKIQLDVDSKWFQYVKEISYEDKGFKLFNIKESGEKIEIAESVGNSVWIAETPNSNSENKGLDIVMNFGEYSYNSGSDDEEIKIMASIGPMSANIDCSYSYDAVSLNEKELVGNSSSQGKLVKEKIQLKEISFGSSLFSFLIAGEGEKKPGSTTLDWEINAAIDGYSKFFDFYANLTKASLSKMSKTHNTNIISITDDKISQIKKLFEELPEAIIDGDNISFNFLKKEDEMTIGGVDVMAIFGKISLIFLGKSKKNELQYQ